MNDEFSKWFDEYGRKWVTSRLSLSETVRGLAHAAYTKGLHEGQKHAPKALPGVTSQQILNKIRKAYWDDHEILADVLADWFNDPNRDAPVKPTMHPDLEWLASLPPEKLKTTPHAPGLVHFYRYCSEGSYYEDRVGVAIGRSNIPKNRYGFTLAEIEQARRHLARKEVNSVVRERAESLDLNNLPDYETWFEEHGQSETVMAGDGLAPARQQGGERATVHELYTHFRARLLDELRQAGVIGDDQ